MTQETKNHKQVRRRRNKCKRLKICTECGSEDLKFDGSKYQNTCQPCAEKKLERVKRRQSELFELGLCVSCGKPRENKVVQRCNACALKQRERMRRYYRKKVGIPEDAPLDSRGRATET